MRRAYKFRLYPNKQQEEKLFWTLARCRELYNAALAERKDAYRMAGKSINYYEQKRDLPEIKEIRPEYHDIHSQVLQDVLLRLKRAFDQFFERVKNGEKPGYPRFQGRNRYDSFQRSREIPASHESSRTFRAKVRDDSWSLTTSLPVHMAQDFQHVLF
jgi:transposase